MSRPISRNDRALDRPLLEWSDPLRRRNVSQSHSVGKRNCKEMAKEGRRGKKKCSHCRHLKQRVSF